MEKKIDKAREILGKEMKDATASKRLDAFKDFNQTHALELANYTSEMVLVLTHHSGPGEYGEKGRTPGATIEVAAYHMVNGLPDFNLVESKNTIDK